MTIFRTLLITLPILVLVGCSTSIRDYDQTKPEFHLDEYFSGPLTAKGTLQNFSEKVTRTFCVEMTGEWKSSLKDQNAGILKEDFYFDDGEEQHRTWQLRKNGNEYTGTAADVVGEAYGRTNGNAFHWQYTLDLAIKKDDGSIDNIKVKLDDWIYLLDAKTAINRAKIKKAGIIFGELIIVFEKGEANCGDEWRS